MKASRMKWESGDKDLTYLKGKTVLFSKHIQRHCLNNPDLLNIKLTLGTLSLEEGRRVEGWEKRVWVSVCRQEKKSVVSSK